MKTTPAAYPQPTNPTADTRNAWRSPTAWTWLLLVMALGLLVDLGSKRLAFEYVAGEPVELVREDLLSDVAYSPIPLEHVYDRGVTVLPWRLLELKLVLNPGAVFGIGPDKRYFFIGFTLLALVGGTIVFGRMTGPRQHLAHLAIGLILAGGLGNLYDRLVIGRVRDFLHMLPGYHLPFGWSWPGGNSEVFPWIFNIADVMLLTGVGLLMLHINRVEKLHQRRLKAAEAAIAATTTETDETDTSESGDDDEA